MGGGHSFVGGRGTFICYACAVEVDCMLESIHSPRGPRMNRINDLRIVCMLVVLI